MGNLYGTTSSGGQGFTGGDGVVFRLTPPVFRQTSWTETVLHSFNILSSGQNPLGELVAAPDGRLFGVTYSGGLSLLGTVFEVTP